MTNVEITKNVFDMMNSMTNDFINRAYVVPPVNSYMVRKTGNEYIVFVLKDFSAFKITFGDRCFNVIMKDAAVQINIVESADMFERITTNISEKAMLDDFLKTVKGLCIIERRCYIPTVQEKTRIIKKTKLL